jgi:hypothetical protein
MNQMEINSYKFVQAAVILIYLRKVLGSNFSRYTNYNDSVISLFFFAPIFHASNYITASALTFSTSLLNPAKQFDAELSERWIPPPS